MNDGPPVSAEIDQALYGSWRQTARVALLVCGLTILVWTFCQLLGWSIATTTSWLFETARGEPLFDGQLLIIAVLIAGGIARAVLTRWPSWDITTANSFNIALDNYHSTSKREAGPELRFKRPDFSLAFKKTIATFLAIGTGGAGGTTAPMVTIAEAIGAAWARITGVQSTSELRTYQLAAIAAAIATLFRSPFAAALFAVELVYGGRIVYQKIVFCLLAAILAYSLTEYALPLDPIYLPPPHERAYGFTDYAITTLVAALVSGPIAIGFGWFMTRAQIIAERRHPAIRAIVGTLLTALIAITLWELVGMDPQHVLGTGAASVEMLFAGDDPNMRLWWFLALIVLGRMLTVALTAGSGGSIGLFLPAAFFGGMSGAAAAELLNSWNVFGPLDPNLFMVVGIASALVAIVRIPLAAIALTMEIFGVTYGPAAVLACAITYVVSLRIQVYMSQPFAPVSEKAGARA